MSSDAHAQEIQRAVAAKPILNATKYVTPKNVFIMLDMFLRCKHHINARRMILHCTFVGELHHGLSAEIVEGLCGGET